MRILYSKHAIKSLVDMDERSTKKVIDHIEKALKEFPADGSAQSSLLDKKKHLVCLSYHVLYKFAIFKDQPVLYVLEVLDEEGYEYATS